MDLCRMDREKTERERSYLLLAVLPFIPDSRYEKGACVKSMYRSKNSAGVGFHGARQAQCKCSVFSCVCVLANSIRMLFKC